jgi:hypothetical protein
MRFINLLNTNKVNTDHRADPNASNISNEKLGLELANTLRDNFVNTITSVDYIGQGINGELYKLIDQTEQTSKNGSQYICKVIAFNPGTLKQLKRELGLLRTIQSHPYMNEYINPCLSVIVQEGYILSIFPVFNGITLDNVIALFNTTTFNKLNRVLLTKYIIKSILEAVYYFHWQNVCHLQINGDSVLVELREPSRNDIQNNKYIDTTPISNNNEVEVSPEEKQVLTNFKIYKPAFSPDLKPLQIKFTNFGIGCGKNILGSSFESCAGPGIDYSIDPYITPGLLSRSSNRNSSQLALAKKYDIWLTGLLLLKLITPPGTDLNNLDNITGDMLVDPEFKLYWRLIMKYMLCPLKNRQDTKFVQEMINLGEKHDEP